MRRREFITLLGGAAAWPIAAHAQQRATPVMGLLNGVSFEGAFAPYVDEIRIGLKEAGFVEGQNVAIEYRTADGHPERLADLAADLVRRKVAVIVTIGGTSTALAVKAATSTIPIVFAMGGDAVESGLVKSLGQPEANVTGISFTTSQLAPKRLDLLRELVPRATLVGFLDNTVNPSQAVRRDLMAKAQSIGRKIAVFLAGTEPEIDQAFADMAQQRVGGLVVGTDAYLNTRRDQILALAQRYAISLDRPLGPRHRHGRRPGELRDLVVGDIPAGRRLCGPHPQGRQACRPAGAAPDPVRAGHQPQDRQDARPHRAA
jgi:putative ABC transport system substrate-binding protein